MIHYHGTPLGGPRQDGPRFLQGRHALIPFTYQDDIGVVAECCQSFVLDNGAFTIWNKGGTLNVDGYSVWVEKWHKHPSFDWALIPDVIDGNEEDNDALIRNWNTKMRGVPVWHMHESIERLVMLSLKWDFVALGSSGQYASPGTSDWWTRMTAAMNAIVDDQGRPNCRLHGLRMLDPVVFTKLPLSSADSTNAAVNSGSLSRFGQYLPPTSSQRAAVIAARIEAHNSAHIWQQQPEESCLF